MSTPYRAADAVSTFKSYIDPFDFRISTIEDTKDRGLLLQKDEFKCVVYIHPISYSTQRTSIKYFIDTRDSGVRERFNARRYAQTHDIKYFLIAVNDQVDKYKDYVLSLESDENTIVEISGTRDGLRYGSGNQAVIPSSLQPSGKFERIKTDMGFYLSAIHRDELADYLIKFDNRPYENEVSVDLIPQSIPEEIDQPHQRIFAGAPGTGKSFQLNRESSLYFGENVSRVTFHPTYLHSDFIGAYKPYVKILRDTEGHVLKDKNGNIEEKIVYRFVPGVFLAQLMNAIIDPQNNYIVVIEEINRANAAAVFGNFFQLFDRDDKGYSEYPITLSQEIRDHYNLELQSEEALENARVIMGKNLENIVFPPNFYIWASMNSADQGVYPLDTAFKRRWEFTYIGIDDAARANQEDFDAYKFRVAPNIIAKWEDFRQMINERLAKERVPEDKLLGPYFISKNILDSNDLELITQAVKDKVMMYLYDDAAKPVRPKFFNSEKTKTFGDVRHYFDQDARDLFDPPLNDLEVTEI